nr:uncharacterized protein LOC115260251 [Aedes albopictus]
MRYYECSRIKARCKPQCARKVLVFIPNNQHDVVVSARGSHSCSNAPTDHLARTPLAADDQHFIEAMLKAGHPTRDVKAGVKARNPKISNNQLGYAVKITKVNMFGNGELSLGELETWTRTMLTPPEDDRKGFVVGKDIDHENGRFRIVVSSKVALVAGSVLGSGSRLHIQRQVEAAERALGTFKSRLLEIVFEYGDPERTIVCERIFDLETERKTYDWLKTSKKVRTVNCQETLKCFTYIPGKEVNDITSQDIVSFEQPKLDSFEKFAADFGKLHRVEKQQLPALVRLVGVSLPNHTYREDKR